MVTHPWFRFPDLLVVPLLPAAAGAIAASTRPRTSGGTLAGPTYRMMTVM